MTKNRTGRVFVVQDHRRWERGKLVPRFDITDAERFGEVVTLLAHDANPHVPGDSAKRLMSALEDFSDGDYLLAIGNPVFIGWAFAYAAAYNKGRVKTLVWERDPTDRTRRRSRYISVSSDLPGLD